MPNYNKVLLMGNITRDPELKYTPSNTAVGNIGLAVNRKYKDGNGETREEVTFVDCECWGATAENISKYFSKGHPIFVEGRLKLDQWKDKDGGARSKLKVVIETFQFVASKGDKPQSAPSSREPAPAYTGPAAPVGDDDIPF